MAAPTGKLFRCPAPTTNRSSPRAWTTISMPTTWSGTGFNPIRGFRRLTPTPSIRVQCHLSPTDVLLCFRFYAHLQPEHGELFQPGFLLVLEYLPAHRPRQDLGGLPHGAARHWVERALHTHGRIRLQLAAGATRHPLPVQ